MKSLVLTVLLLAVAACVAQQRSKVAHGKTPAGWMLAPSRKQDPELWRCAGYGGSRVVVKNADGNVTITDLNLRKDTQPRVPADLKLTAEMVGRRSVLRTGDGYLIGFDAGEFGGGLWWFSRNGGETQKLLPDNVKAIYHTPNNTVVLTGLAHLSHNDGAVYKFTDTPDKVTITWLARLGRSPEASTLDAAGDVIIATTDSILGVTPAGDVRRIYESDEPLVYPTSVQVDNSGVINVGMRFFVLRLIPRATGEYHREWLMPQKCAVNSLKKNICTCRGTR